MMSVYITPFITVYSIVIAALLGACFGSFICCLSWRTVHGESVLKGRSHCDSCGHVLSVADLIPIAGFIINKGKCRYCGAKLSLLMPISEAVCAVSFALLTLRFDLTAELIEYIVFACILLGCACADLECGIIPDRFILSAIAVRLIFILISGDILKTLIFSLIGGVSVSVALLIIVLISEKIMKKEAMGGGDIKLLFVTGLYFGWKSNILCLIFACIFGIIFGLAAGKKSDGKGDIPAGGFPWGPSISAAALVVTLIGDIIISMYLGLLGI